MPYVPIDSNDIEIGKPTKKSIFKTIKDNLDDHESRIDSVQAGASKVEIFNFEVFGYINDYTISELTSIGITESTINYSVTAMTVSLQNNPQFLQSTSTGALEIDLEKSIDNGITWTSIMTTIPSIPNGINSTGYKSTNGVINTLISSVNQGDLLRVSVKSMKENQGSFNITVYGEL